MHIHIYRNRDTYNITLYPATFESIGVYAVFFFRFHVGLCESWRNPLLTTQLAQGIIGQAMDDLERECHSFDLRKRQANEEAWAVDHVGPLACRALNTPHGSPRTHDNRQGDTLWYLNHP